MFKKSLFLKLLVLLVLSFVTFGGDFEPKVSAECGATCVHTDDGSMGCLQGTSYRNYCSLWSGCEPCTPPPGQNVCIPQCYNYCYVGWC